jgi:hypothetical protein
MLSYKQKYTLETLGILFLMLASLALFYFIWGGSKYA